MRKDDAGIYGVPTLYDVSGSADFRNMTHNGYTIYRHFEDDNGQEDETEFINMKTKFSFQGKMQESIRFKFCKFNGRYYSNDVEPTYSMLLGEDAYKEKELPKLLPCDVFDDNEVPF